MSTSVANLPAPTGGAEVTRFNALKHGVLSRYTVLPWEDPEEYRALVDALTARGRRTRSRSAPISST